MDKMEKHLEKCMYETLAKSFTAYHGFVKDQKENLYNEYFNYASKLPKSQRFGKSSMVLAQALNLLKYRDCKEKFKPLKFTPHLVEI